MSYNDNVLSHYGIQKTARGDTFGRQLNEARAAVVDSFLDELVDAFKNVAKGQIERGYKVKRHGDRVTLTGRTYGLLGAGARVEMEADDLHIQVGLINDVEIKTVSNLLQSGKKKDARFPILSMSASQVAQQCFYEHFHGLVP